MGAGAVRTEAADDGGDGGGLHVGEADEDVAGVLPSVALEDVGLQIVEEGLGIQIRRGFCPIDWCVEEHREFAHG
jgi:hypothetical protein